MASSKDPGGRPLSAWEDIMDAYQSIGNCIFSCGLMLTVSGKLEVDTVRNVLLNLQKRHQLLHMKIDNDGVLRHFVPMQNDLLDFEEITTSDWESVSEKMLRTQFNKETGPLWRAKLVRLRMLSTDTNKSSGRDVDKESVAMLFAFHHAIADGVSVAKVLHEFVEMTDSYMSNEPIDDLPPLPILQSMKHLLPPRDFLFRCMDMLKLFGIVKNQLIPGKNHFLERFPALVKENPIAEPETRMVAFNLSQPDTEALLAKCKRERTTVHGALAAAAAISLRDIIQPKKKKTLLMPTKHPVNMRYFCRPPVEPEHLMYMVLTVDSNLKVPKRPSFWSFARKSSQSIRRALASNEHMALFNISEKVYNRETFLKRIANSQEEGGRNPYYFTLSNIGNLDKILNASFVNIEVEDVLTSTGIHAEGPLFLHNVLTFRKQLRWHLNYPAHVVRRQHALDHAAQIQKILIGAIRGSEVQSTRVYAQQLSRARVDRAQDLRVGVSQPAEECPSVSGKVLRSKERTTSTQHAQLARIDVLPCPSERITYWPYTELPPSKSDQISVFKESDEQEWKGSKMPWTSRDLTYVRAYNLHPLYTYTRYQPHTLRRHHVNQPSPMIGAWQSYAVGPVPYLMPRRQSPGNAKSFWW